jgi:hypothetical protein
MQYFATLPKLLQTNAGGNSVLLTNLMARASVIPSLLNNAALFYQYDIQDGDTPESIAYKYYGESYRYWIVLFANQILDPQWQWPMNSNVFETYLIDKYGSIPNETHSYQKIITQVDEGTNTTTIKEIDIDANTYNALALTTTYYDLPTGRVVITIDKKITSVYEYEVAQNEKNRTIRLLNNTFVGEIENEYKSLMSS